VSMESPISPHYPIAISLEKKYVGDLGSGDTTVGSDSLSVKHAHLLAWLGRGRIRRGAARPARENGAMLGDEERPLRICLLSYRSNPHCGGQGVYLKNLAIALKGLGHHVEVMTGPPDPLLDNGITVHKIPCLDLYNPEDLFRVPSLQELLDPINLIEWLGVCSMGFPEPFTFGLRAYRFLGSRWRNYDVVHDNQSLSYGLLAINRLAPTIATIHHPITVDRDLAIKSESSLWKKMKHMRWYSFVGMQKRVSRFLSRIITVSECARDDISEAFGVSPDRFRVVPNGINTDLFRPIPQVQRVPNRVIVTNSADTPLKGLRYLLEAVAQVSQTHDVSLIVVGSPRKDGYIETLMNRLGLWNRVTFTGRISDQELVEQYAKASIAVIPSLYEGFGLPAGEAMACAVPVISSKGGALPEVVGDAGILVPPASREALAGAMIRLLDDPQLARGLGEKGLKRVQAHFTWKRSAEKTVEAYREAIRDHR
jgi:glycosyltransferase involved in cell wall biosynthesis